MKKLDRLLTKILAASLMLFLVSLVFSKKEKNAPASVQSALLNQKYKDEVAEIEIKTPDADGAEKITLTRHGDFWLLSAADKTNGRKFRATANSKIIGSLLKKATEIRKMYIISDRISDYSAFSVGEDNGTVVRFSRNADETIASIFFGYSDTLKNRIFLRSVHSPSVYECENEFQQYLTTDSNYWAAGEILPEIARPVFVSFEKGGEAVSFDEKSDGFSSTARTLLSLRHGAVRSEELIREKIDLKKIARLTVQDGDGREAQIDFFEKTAETAEGLSDSEEISYFYTKSVRASEIDSQETRFALYSESALYEISGWTFAAICAKISP